MLRAAGAALQVLQRGPLPVGLPAKAAWLHPSTWAASLCIRLTFCASLRCAPSRSTSRPSAAPTARGKSVPTVESGPHPSTSRLRECCMGSGRSACQCALARRGCVCVGGVRASQEGTGPGLRLPARRCAAGSVVWLSPSRAAMPALTVRSKSNQVKSTGHHASPPAQRPAGRRGARAGRGRRAAPCGPPRCAPPPCRRPPCLRWWHDGGAGAVVARRAQQGQPVAGRQARVHGEQPGHLALERRCVAARSCPARGSTPQRQATPWSAHLRQWPLQPPR